MLSVDANRRSRSDKSAMECFDRLNDVKCCCPDRLGSGSFAGSSGSARTDVPFETNQSDNISNFKSYLKHDLKKKEWFAA